MSVRLNRRAQPLCQHLLCSKREAFTETGALLLPQDLATPAAPLTSGFFKCLPVSYTTDSILTPVLSQLSETPSESMQMHSVLIKPCYMLDEDEMMHAGVPAK